MTVVVIFSKQPSLKIINIMKKNLYFRSVYGRSSFLNTLLALFYQISSFPRLLMEVFIRKNMGERYFSFSASIILSLFFIAHFIMSVIAFGRGPAVVAYGGYFSMAFAVGFLYYANIRRKEVKMGPQTVDFEKFSLSSGEFTGWFKQQAKAGRSTAMMEKYIEPAPFLIGGIILAIIPITRVLGFAFIISSVIYSLSYMGAYVIARNSVLDIIDEKISGEVMKRAMDGMDQETTKGFTFRGPVPQDPEQRKQVLNEILAAESDSVVL